MKKGKGERKKEINLLGPCDRYENMSKGSKIPGLLHEKTKKRMKKSPLAALCAKYILFLLSFSYFIAQE